MCICIWSFPGKGVSKRDAPGVSPSRRSGVPGKVKSFTAGRSLSAPVLSSHWSKVLWCEHLSSLGLRVFSNPRISFSSNLIFFLSQSKFRFHQSVSEGCSRVFLDCFFFFLLVVIISVVEGDLTFRLRH